MEYNLPTQYPEFDFEGHFTDVVDASCRVNETITDPEAQHDALQKLVYEATRTLQEQDILGAEAIVGTGAYIEIDTESGTGLAFTDTPMTGRYMGLALISESPDVGEFTETYNRWYIGHRVLISSQSVNTGFREKTEKLYAIAPIDKLNVEIIKPIPAYSDHEQWLRQVFQPIYQAPYPDFSLIARTFDRIQAAPQSEGVLDKNIDWCIDQLNEFLDLSDCSITAHAFRGLREEGQREQFFNTEDSAVPISGLARGFCLMPKYDGGEVPIKVEGQDLAICIETVVENDATWLTRIPVHYLLDIDIELND
jgi:hypothetical protein